MNPFSVDLLKVLKLLKYKYDARFLLSDPEKASDFPFFKIYLSEEELKRAGVPLTVIDILHGSINRTLEIPSDERSEWYETFWPTGYDEPFDVPDKEKYLVFTVTPSLETMIKDVEEKTDKKITYYDISNSSLVVNGVAHKVSRKSDKSNAHHILKYIFEHDPTEEHFYSEMEEEKILSDEKEWDTYYKSLNTVKDKLDQELGIKDFFEKISTGKTGSVKINSKYL